MSLTCGLITVEATPGKKTGKEHINQSIDRLIGIPKRHKRNRTKTYKPMNPENPINGLSK